MTTITTCERSVPDNNDICFSYENIYRAYVDCRKNKRSRPDAIQYELNAEEYLYDLRNRLLDGSYHPSCSGCFVTRKPKLREIFAAGYEDRILHHLLVRYLEEIWNPKFIYDSYASRERKGIHLAVKRMRSFTRKVTKNRTQSAYYMQLDIRNFFMRIDKDILYELIQSGCRNPRMLWLARVIIFHDPTRNYHLKSSRKLLASVPQQKSLFYSASNKGLPIGNLTSQFFANVYLNGLDHFIKRELKCRYYARYVDDFVLLDPDRERLLQWKERIVEFLDGKLQLELNPSRTRILPVKNGIDFLGYIIRPNYVLCRQRVVNNLKSKLDEYEKKLINVHHSTINVKYDSEILESLFAAMNSYLAHFHHACTFKLIGGLFQRYSFLNHYFIYYPVLGVLYRWYMPPKRFRNVCSQYLFFLNRFMDALIFFQVGCFYEFYGIQALRAVKYLKLKRIKRKYGFSQRCGIGKDGLARYIDMALESGFNVVVVKQTGHRLVKVSERTVHQRYILKHPITVLPAKEMKRTLKNNCGVKKNQTEEMINEKERELDTDSDDMCDGGSDGSSNP